MTTAAATGIKKAGADLNTILEGRTTTAIANTGIKKGGVDIATIFEKLASGTAPAATGIKKAGADLNTLFAAIGTVGGGLVTTITSARSAIIKSKKKGTKVTDLIYAWGFDAGSDSYSLVGSFGSIADGTYDDGGSNSRLVDSCYWVSNDNDKSKRHFLYFVLDTTSVPNTDTTFVSIKIDGVTFTRSSAAYTASVDGGTRWKWSSVATDPFAGTNPDDFEVVI